MSDLERIKELLPKFSEQTINDFIEKLDSTVEATPMSEENKQINSQIMYEKAFHELMLEILDFDIGLVEAKKSFTYALLNSGSQYNPQSLFQLLDLITTRMERIHLVKRLCGFLGLQNEMDRLLDRELDLIYKTPQYNIPKPMDTSIPIAGEHRNG